MTHAIPMTFDALNALQQSRALPVVAVIAIKFAVTVTNWSVRRRTRASLAKLETWQLRDVGLTDEQASTEASRLFWKK